MKIARLVAMAALAGIIVKSGEAGQATERKVTVCMNESLDGPVIEDAEAIVSRTFKAIGVKTEWHDLGRDCPVGDDVIRIQLLTVSPEHYHPGAFAFAWPYEGVHIQVFGDRMERLIGHHDLQYVLAHVLVHEITHLLQGVNRHSSSGIMKAGWDNQDYAQMPEAAVVLHRARCHLDSTGHGCKGSAPPGSSYRCRRSHEWNDAVIQ